MAFASGGGGGGSGGGSSDGSGATVAFDTAHIADVKTWLNSVFDAVGKEVPDFEYTPRTVSHLHNLAMVSQSRTQMAGIVAADLRQKATEFRGQAFCLELDADEVKILLEAARIREILEFAGLSHDNFTPNGVESVHTLARAAHILDLKDTEVSSFLVAMADLSLKKVEIEERRHKAHQESKALLDNTRKAIARLTYLKRTLTQLEEEMAGREASMVQWQTNIKIMASKERQYLQQLANFKAILARLGYTPEISHGVLMQMVENRRDLERKTKPILETLRSYQDLPPDKALAELAIEDKRREYEAAEKYLEEALQSALYNPNE